MSQADLFQNLRKLGDPRTETISVVLTEHEIAEQKARSCELRNAQDALKRERADAMAAFKARAAALSSAEELCRQRASTGRSDLAVVVQDFITPGNEVLTVRIDTSDVVNRRTATADELQEEIFGGSA